MNIKTNKSLKKMKKITTINKVIVEHSKDKFILKDVKPKNCSIFVGNGYITIEHASGTSQDILLQILRLLMYVK